MKVIQTESYRVTLNPTSMIYEANGQQTMIALDVTIDEPQMGGKIKISWKDRWGSEMTFIHYEPSDIKGMIEFILKGYGILPKDCHSAATSILQYYNVTEALIKAQVKLDAIEKLINPK